MIVKLKKLTLVKNIWWFYFKTSTDIHKANIHKQLDTMVCGLMKITFKMHKKYEYHSCSLLWCHCDLDLLTPWSQAADCSVSVLFLVYNFLCLASCSALSLFCSSIRACSWIFATSSRNCKYTELTLHMQWPR